MALVIWPSHNNPGSYVACYLKPLYLTSGVDEESRIIAKGNRYEGIEAKE